MAGALVHDQAQRVARGNTCRDRASVEAAIAVLTKPRWVREVIEPTLTGQDPAEVVAAYRSQSEVESSFRQMNDPQVVSFGPMHHWPTPRSGSTPRTACSRWSSRT